MTNKREGKQVSTEEQGIARPPRVFIINEPLKKDLETGELEPFLPMESAANFGDVVKVTPDGSPPGNLKPYLAMLREKLADFREEDYLVLVGDQALLVAAAAIVGTSETGKLRVLKWERRLNAYAPLVLDTGEPQ